MKPLTEVRLAAIDHEEMRDLVLEAWSMVVPKYVIEDYLRVAQPPPR